MAATFRLVRHDGTGFAFVPEHTLRTPVGEGTVMFLSSGQPSMTEVKQLMESVYEDYRTVIEERVPMVIALTAEYDVGAGVQSYALNPDSANGGPCKGGNMVIALKGKMDFTQLRQALDSLERKLEVLYRAN